jgi:hypothetical protein
MFEHQDYQVKRDGKHCMRRRTATIMGRSGSAWRRAVYQTMCCTGTPI